MWHPVQLFCTVSRLARQAKDPFEAKRPDRSLVSRVCVDTPGRCLAQQQSRRRIGNTTSISIGPTSISFTSEPTAVRAIIFFHSILLPRPFTLDVDGPCLVAAAGPSNCSGNRRDDPVWDAQLLHGWRGVAVEANPHTYHTLRGHYRACCPNVKTMNLAVSDASAGSSTSPTATREVDFWCPREPANLRYSEGCTTVRAWGEGSKFGLQDDARATAQVHHMRVPAITLGALWSRLAPRKVDLLVIE